MKTLVVMALEAEAQNYFYEARIPVLFTGMGQVNASMKLAHHLALNGPHRIVNLGTAGSTREAVGSIFEIQRVYQRDVDLSLAGLPQGRWPGEATYLQLETMDLGLNQCSCASGDSIRNSTWRSPEEPKTKFNEEVDVFDMELYALAKVAKFYHSPISSVKYITDSSDHKTKDSWKANVSKASLELFNIFELYQKKSGSKFD
jgi:adenosylhomocysteine nucleosidase